MERLINVLKLMMGRGSEEERIPESKFVPIEPEKREVVAVDGGNAVVYDGGAWILSKIRVSAVGYSGKERVFEEKDAVEVHCLVGQGKRVEFDKDIGFPDVDFKSQRFDEVANCVRSIMERMAAIDQLERMNKGDVLLLDALLRPEVQGEKELIDKLVSKAAEKGVSIVGVAKTSRLTTRSGRSKVGRLNEVGPSTRWKFNLGSEHGYRDVVARFHPRSKHCYRCHVVGDGLGAAAYYSSDPELVGYPYPLLKVDKVARISSHERESEKRSVKLLARRMGLDGFDYDIRSQDFHEKLDRRMYR